MTTTTTSTNREILFHRFWQPFPSPSTSLSFIGCRRFFWLHSKQKRNLWSFAFFLQEKRTKFSQPSASHKIINYNISMKWHTKAKATKTERNAKDDRKLFGDFFPYVPFEFLRSHRTYSYWQQLECVKFGHRLPLPLCCCRCFFLFSIASSRLQSSLDKHSSAFVVSVVDSIENNNIRMKLYIILCHAIYIAWMLCS